MMVNIDSHQSTTREELFHLFLSCIIILLINFLNMLSIISRSLVLMRMIQKFLPLWIETLKCSTSHKVLFYRQTKSICIHPYFVYSKSNKWRIQGCVAKALKWGMCLSIEFQYRCDRNCYGFLHYKCIDLYKMDLQRGNEHKEGNARIFVFRISNNETFTSLVINHNLFSRFVTINLDEIYRMGKTYQLQSITWFLFRLPDFLGFLRSGKMSYHLRIQ